VKAVPQSLAEQSAATAAAALTAERIGRAVAARTESALEMLHQADAAAVFVRA